MDNKNFLHLVNEAAVMKAELMSAEERIDHNENSWINLSDDVRRIQVKLEFIQNTNKDILDRIQAIEEALLSLSTLTKSIYDILNDLKR